MNRIILLLLILFMAMMGCSFDGNDPIKKQIKNSHKIIKEEIKNSHKILDNLSLDSRNIIEKGRVYVKQIKDINLDGHSVNLKKQRELASEKLKDSEIEYHSVGNKITEARESLNKVSRYIDSWRSPQFVRQQFNYIYIDLITLSLLEFYVEIVFSTVEKFKSTLLSEQENIERIRQEREDREQARLEQERLEQETEEVIQQPEIQYIPTASRPYIPTYRPDSQIEAWIEEAEEMAAEAQENIDILLENRLPEIDMVAIGTQVGTEMREAMEAMYEAMGYGEYGNFPYNYDVSSQ